MINIYHSRIYLNSQDALALKGEPEYVQKRYNLIALLLLPKPFGISRQQAADMLHRSKRHVYRILQRFRREGIPGLRHRSKKPKNIPKISPEWIEKMVIQVRQRTGFSPQNVSIIVNEGLEKQGSRKRVSHSLAYKILVRNGLMRAKEKETKKDWKRFDWKRPNNLIQADLTELNTLPILTMEDDHTRKVWSKVIRNEKTETVTGEMSRLVPRKYNNLLTDNGKQFSETNPVMRKYLEGHVWQKHIHARVRHPQTLGKLSAYQRRLKEFLRYHLGESRNVSKISRYIRIFNLFHNNGRRHSTTGEYPEESYSGKRKGNWFTRVVKIFKLEGVFMVPAEG